MMAAFCPKCGAQRNAGLECGSCGVIYAKAEQQAYHAMREQKTGPKPASPVIASYGGFNLDCQACKLTEAMERKTIPRFPPFIRIIGFIIATPSAVGIGIGLISMVLAVFDRSPSATGGFFVSGLLVILSAVFGLVGWLLLMRKKAWVCNRCGYLIDRA